MSGQSQDKEWQKVWDARSAALTKILGEDAGSVYTAAPPFYLGGFADVVPFPSYVPGMTYVTADLTGGETGQLPTSLGNYELMICAKSELDAAVDLISRLSRYTCDAAVEPGQTMDIPNFFGDATLRGLLFANVEEPPPSFDVLDQKCGLLLCIGITAEELKFKQKHGSEKLLALLKEHKVFPYTIPDRKSVPLAG